jgi:hypothetical protein
MNLFRAIILVGCTSTLGGAGWLAANGVWSEDSDALAPRSLRTDSTGNTIGNANVK